MYQEHFNLTDLPFENTPNPAFFYGGGQYRECLSAMLHYAANRRGIMGLSGPIGVGKTTLVHTLRRVLPDNTKVISLIHPESTPLELLTYVAQGLNLEAMPGSRLRAVEVVREELVRLDEAGGVCLLIVDEAQLLTTELMEQIRLLSNLETETHKLIQIILVGQPELVNLLGRPELAAVRQRISLMKILSALSPEESLYYIAHRLSRAGSGLELFSDSALKTVIGYSGGIPRIINQLCEGALVSAYGAESEIVAVPDVEEAAANLLLEGERMLFAPPAQEPAESLPSEPPAPSPEPESESVSADQEEEPGEGTETWKDGPAMKATPEMEESPEEPRKAPAKAEPPRKPAPRESRTRRDESFIGALPRGLVFESDSDPVPAKAGGITGQEAPAGLIASIEDSQTIQDGPSQETRKEKPGPEEEGIAGVDAPAEKEEEISTSLAWNPPPPEPAPEYKEPKPSLFRPIVILIIALLALSASLGFYLALDKKSGADKKQTTITVPLKPGTGKPAAD